MADTTLTGAETDVTLSAAAEEKKKKIIKIAVTVLIVAALAWVVWKYILKR